LAHAVKIKLTRRQERWFEEGRIRDREIGGEYEGVVEKPGEIQT
jgi:hypothetical protein